MTSCSIPCRKLPFLVLSLAVFSCLAAAQVSRSDLQIIHRNDKQLRQIPIDEKTTLLYDEEGSFHYLGSIGQLKNGKPFPHGLGLQRTVVKDPVTGDASIEYCFCTWKRGSRHGEGIMMLPDGSYCKAVWKWDQLKSVSETPPAPEEIKTFEKHVRRLEKLITLL